MRIRFTYANTVRTGELVKIKGNLATIKEDRADNIKTFNLSRMTNVETGDHIVARPEYTREELLAAIDKESTRWASLNKFEDDPLRLVLAAIYTTVPTKALANQREATKYYLEEKYEGR